MLISNRATNILLVAILAVGIGIVAMLASGARGGPLDPPGPPSATGTLPQVEPRMPIPPVGWNGTFPITISQSGSYFLTQNLTGVANTNGIDITVSDVTIDLNGFNLLGANQTGTGIRSVGPASTVVRNGSLTNWGTGVDLQGSLSVRASDLTVTASGVAMRLGNATVEDCHVAGNVGGIVASVTVIRRCQFSFNRGDALSLSYDDSVEDSDFYRNGSSGAGNWDIAVHFGGNVIRGNSSHPVYEKFVGIFPGAVSNTVMSNSYICALGIVDNSGGLNYIPGGSTLDGTNVCF